jgi:hypothetical protein
MDDSQFPSEVGADNEVADRGRRTALVQLGTYSALAPPAFAALLTAKGSAAWAGSGGGTKPKDPKPKDPKDPKPKDPKPKG